MSKQPHQSSAERITWTILLILTALVSYKLGSRSSTNRVQFNETQVQVEQVEGEGLPKQAPLSKSLESSDKLSSSSSPLAESNLGCEQAVKCPPLICPPCDCKPKPRVKPKRKGRKTPPVKARSPIDQQKLLAWVKRYSPRLKRCRDAGQAIYKLHAKVKLNAKKDRILSAKVTGRDVPLSARRCVEYDLKRWPAPQRLSKDHPALLIFGLQLD